MAWWNPWKKKPIIQVAPQKRAFTGAQYSRLTNDWVTSSTSADSEIFSSLRILRNRSRELCRNNDYARGARNTLTRNIVGKGFQFQSKVPQKRGKNLNDKINTEIEEVWAEWCEADRCHVAGKLDFVEIESLAIASIIESGEVLIRFVQQKFGESSIPLGLEIIESDQLADDYSVGQTGNGNSIKMGVEMDRWGRAVAYHVYPYHPGDYQFSVNNPDNRIQRIPASEIIHLYLCERSGQSRGLPWFYSTLMRMRQLGGYEEAELVAARAQAAVMGFIETPDGDLLGDGTENGQRLNTLEPGVMEILAPGEKFSGFAPTRPGDAFDPFVRMMLRGAAVGVGLSYESFSGDYTNTSYSSARTSTMNERDQYRIIQDWLGRKLLQPVFKAWLNLAVLSGNLNLPDYESNRRFYCKPQFSGRSWQWVDPNKDIKAKTDAIAAGLETQTSVLAEQGKDIEDLLKERRHELDLAAGLGLDFGAGGGGAIPAGQTPGNPSGGDVTGQTPSNPVDLPPAQLAEGMTAIERTHEKRAKNCTKGISCGNTCIAKSKTCIKTLPANQQPKKQEVAGGKGAAKQPAAGAKENADKGAKENADKAAKETAQEKPKTKAQLAKEAKIAAKQAKEAQEKLDRVNFEERISQREKAIKDASGELVLGSKMTYDVQPARKGSKDGTTVIDAKSSIRKGGRDAYVVNAVTMSTEKGKYDLAFMVNGRYEQVSMAKEFSAKVVSHIKLNIDRVMAEVPPGSIIFNTPYSGDGLGDKRASLYKRYGFVETSSGQAAVWTGSKFVSPSKYEPKNKAEAAQLKELKDELS